MAEKPNTGNPVGDPVVKGFEVLGKRPGSGEFNRFEKLTGKLAKGQKSELDEQRKKS
ncbi:MAG: hypothetical protein M3R39_00495 [Actinomycetota bacterium]|nr:hypothetical protein [Actinomycetota bacterium]